MKLEFLHTLQVNQFNVKISQSCLWPYIALYFLTYPIFSSIYHWHVLYFQQFHKDNKLKPKETTKIQWLMPNAISESLSESLYFVVRPYICPLSALYFHSASPISNLADIYILAKVIRVQP